MAQELQTRTVYLAALNRHVALGAYVNAVKTAKAHPDTEFKCGLASWWPTTGAEIVRQFRQGMTDRINQAVPYHQRGIALGRAQDEQTGGPQR